VEVSRIIAEIDSQISKLQQARALLSDTATAPVAAVKKAGRGRPKGSKNAAKKAAAVTTPAPVPAKVKAKRKLSPEGRKRIADAMKKRWAERRKLTSK
jgi:hypothetical protein